MNRKTIFNWEFSKVNLLLTCNYSVSENKAFNTKLIFDTLHDEQKQVNGKTRKKTVIEIERNEVDGLKKTGRYISQL